MGFAKQAKISERLIGSKLQLKASTTKQNIVYTILGGNVIKVKSRSLQPFIPTPFLNPHN